MSSKSSINSSDNHRNANQTTVPSYQPDNKVFSLENGYEELGITNGEGDIKKNGEKCDNTGDKEYIRDKDKCIINETSSLTPKNARKFSPDKIKGKIF